MGVDIQGSTRLHETLLAQLEPGAAAKQRGIDIARVGNDLLQGHAGGGIQVDVATRALDRSRCQRTSGSERDVGDRRGGTNVAVGGGGCGDRTVVGLDLVRIQIGLFRSQCHVAAAMDGVYRKHGVRRVQPDGLIGRGVQTVIAHLHVQRSIHGAAATGLAADAAADRRQPDATTLDAHAGAAQGAEQVAIGRRQRGEATGIRGSDPQVPLDLLQ